MFWVEKPGNWLLCVCGCDIRERRCRGGTIEKGGRINIEVDPMSGQQAANEDGQGEGWGGDFWCRVRSVFSGQGLRWRSALVAPFIYMREETLLLLTISKKSAQHTSVVGTAATKPCRKFVCSGPWAFLRAVDGEAYPVRPAATQPRLTQGPACTACSRRGAHKTVGRPTSPSVLGLCV